MHTDEIPLSTTAERQAVAAEAGAAPDKDWVIVTRGLKRDYDMGGEVVHALRGVDIAIRRNEYVETDHLTDSVWVACEQGDRLGDVIASVAERTGLPLGEATAAAVFTIERFRALGFVTYK